MNQTFLSRDESCSSSCRDVIYHIRNVVGRDLSRPVSRRDVDWARPKYREFNDLTCLRRNVTNRAFCHSAAVRVGRDESRPYVYRL